MRRADLDALAAAHGLELRIVRDESAPMMFAVWGWSPDTETESDSDIIGAGETEGEAIDAAREQLRAWESAS